MADVRLFYPGGPNSPVEAAETAAISSAVTRTTGDGLVGADIEFWTGTQAQYDALATTATPPGAGYEANTLYIIIPTNP